MVSVPSSKPAPIATHTELHKQISALKQRYVDAIDSQRWDDLRQVFHPRLTLRGYGFDRLNDLESVIEEYKRVFSHVHASHHHISEPEMVRTSLAEVRVRWCFEDELMFKLTNQKNPLMHPRIPNQTGLRGTGWYEDRVYKSSAGWRITSSQLFRSSLIALTPEQSHVLLEEASKPSVDWLHNREPAVKDPCEEPGNAF